MTLRQAKKIVRMTKAIRDSNGRSVVVYTYGLTTKRTPFGPHSRNVKEVTMSGTMNTLEESESILTRIRREWSGKPPTKKELAELKKAYLDAVGAIARAKDMLNAANLAEQEAMLNIFKAVGGRPFTLDGELLTPGCKGKTVFVKRSKDPLNVISI